MSGTSVDGIDAALVEIDGAGYDLTLTLVAGESRSYRASLQQAILQAAAGDGITLEDLASLDDAIALEFAQVAQVLIDRCGPVDLIASHGQTVFHRSVGGQATKVTGGLGYSQQLGRGSVIAHHLGLPTVSNFRQADIDAGERELPWCRS
jgi:anhydro-N-acetylmuramic acid kinase